MGQTLARAAHWTTALDDTKGKIEATKRNDSILKDITEFSSGYASKNADIAKLIFKKPLCWATSLPIDKISNILSEKDGLYVSDETDSKSGNFMMTLDTTREEPTISVLSMEYVAKILSIAGGGSQDEIRACLEKNNDPTAVMLGERFATVAGEDNSLFRFIEEMSKDISSARGDDKSENAKHQHREKERILKMLIDIQRLDNRMLYRALTEASEEVRLDPSSVDKQVETLQSFSGPQSDKHILRYIEYTDSPLSPNGCRAPTVRQMYGDISYLKVKTYEGEDLDIAASVEGYYIYKGKDENGNIDYTKEGEVHKDLASLLKTKSPHFSSTIDNQEFSYEEPEDDLALYRVCPSDGEYEDDGSDRAQYREKNDDKGKLKKRKQQNRSQEPSQRWRFLEQDDSAYGQASEFRPPWKHICK